MLLRLNINQATFGSPMPNRSFSASSYKYGFNGKEKDDEVKGEGNSVDFGERIYDTRLGRWLSLDPMGSKFAGFSPYNFCLNNPITLIDPDGLTPEEPVILASKKDPENAPIVEAANNYPYKVGDGVFTIFTHANATTLQYIDDKGEAHYITTASQFDEVMKVKSQAYKEARESGKKIKIILIACDAGVDQLAMPGAKPMPIKPIGQLISELPNVEAVAAPDGQVMFQKSVDVIDNKVVISEKPKILGVQNKTNDGGFNIFKNGEKVAKVEYKAKDHKKSPEVGKTKTYSSKNKASF